MRKLYAFMRNNLLSRDKLNYERGVAKNIHYGDIHTKFQALFDVTRESVPFINESESVPGADSEDYCVEGDLIFADASEDMRDVGKCIEVVRLAGERLLAGQHTILARPKDDALVVGFGGHLFRSGLMRSRIEKEAQGTKVYQISSSRLGGIVITYPSDKGEQQKIADCLTSLDEVIAAQGRKVEALKAHKRGLMQQLFPREGETRPRLRFPEFRDAPEWELTPLSRVFLRITNGKANAQDHEEGGAYPLFDRSEVIKVSASFAFAAEAVIIPGEGASFRPKYFNGKFNLHQRAYALMECQGSAKYFFYALDYAKDALALKAVKSTVLSLRLPIIQKFVVPLPERQEQQRIADCLSSLDTRITAETRQLAALKTHKQGLMQQLFPAPEAA